MIDKNVIASQLSGQQFRISEDMMSAHMETGMTWPQFREKIVTLPHWEATMECHLLEAKGFRTIEGICLDPTCWI